MMLQLNPAFTNNLIESVRAKIHRKPEEVFEKVARADENIVKLADARDQRDGSRPPPYTKTAVEQLVDFYLHRAMWLKRWREEVER